MENPIKFFKSLIISQFPEAKEIINESPYDKTGSRAWFSINERDINQIVEIQAYKVGASFQINSYRLSDQNLREFTNGGFPRILEDKKLTLSGSFDDQGRLTVTEEIDPHHGRQKLTRFGYVVSPDALFFKISESYFEAF